MYNNLLTSLYMLIGSE